MYAVLTDLTQMSMHFRPVDSKVPGLWLTAVVQTRKQQAFVPAVIPTDFCCAYRPD